MTPDLFRLRAAGPRPAVGHAARARSRVRRPPPTPPPPRPTEGVSAPPGPAPAGASRRCSSFDPARQAELEAARPQQPAVVPEVAELIAANCRPCSRRWRSAARAGRPGVAAKPRLLSARSCRPRKTSPTCSRSRMTSDPRPRPRGANRLPAVRPWNRGRGPVPTPPAGHNRPSHRPAAAGPVGRRVSGRRPGHPGWRPMVAEVRFQLFKPSAVRPDGSAPAGFTGSDHWLWPQQPLASVPRIDGERVILLGEPAFRTTWEVERRSRRWPRTCGPARRADPLPGGGPPRPARGPSDPGAGL